MECLMQGQIGSVKPQVRKAVTIPATPPASIGLIALQSDVAGMATSLRNRKPGRYKMTGPAIE
jgi:hypothetical protein